MSRLSTRHVLAIQTAAIRKGNGFLHAMAHPYWGTSSQLASTPVYLDRSRPGAHNWQEDL